MASNSEKKDVRNAKRTASKMRKGTLRISNSAAKNINKTNRADVKRGGSLGFKVTSSGTKLAKTNSVTKPSMPVKTGVKNKLKTQGKAATQSGRGYSRAGKK
jgi:hypothetical protein